MKKSKFYNNIKKYDPYDNYNTVMKIDEFEAIKTFEPYQHYISVKIVNRLDDSSGFNNVVADNISKTINNIPDGYEVYTIYPIKSSNDIDGFVVWFVNNEEVEVEISWNELNNSRGYYNFGKIKEKVKTR